MRFPRGTHAVLSLLLVAGLAGLPAAQAQEPVPSNPDATFGPPAFVSDGPAAPLWGVTSVSYLTRGAWDAHPIDSSFTYDFTNSVNGGQGIHRTAGTQWAKVPIHLPSGALVEAIEVNFCDTGASSFAVFWVRQAKNGNSNFTNLVSSSGTPGCVVQTATLATPQTIDNDANSYNIELSFGSTDSTIQFGSLRVVYRLQVTPAPGTATFGDVPVGHPQHRFVEALVAAGITAGCGAGNYCPDDPVTRGQMAVFLSAALGLHWVP